jgi:hypothetical protein
MPAVSNATRFEKSVAALPLSTCKSSELVLAAGSKTGRLLIVKERAAAIIGGGIAIPLSAARCGPG